MEKFLTIWVLIIATATVVPAAFGLDLLITSLQAYDTCAGEKTGASEYLETQVTNYATCLLPSNKYCQYRCVAAQFEMIDSEGKPNRAKICEAIGYKGFAKEKEIEEAVIECYTDKAKNTTISYTDADDCKTSEEFVKCFTKRFNKECGTDIKEDTDGGAIAGVI